MQTTTRILALLIVAAVAAGCTTMAPDDPDPLPSDCQLNGTGGNAQNPMVCVNAWVQSEADGGSGWVQVTPYVAGVSRRGAMVVQWQTRVPRQPIEVVMKDGPNNNCTTTPQCSGNGQCTLVIRPNATIGTKCAYSVNVTFPNGSSITLDPMVEIEH